MVQNKSIKTFWAVFFALVAVVAVASSVAMYFAAESRVARINMSTVSDENVYKINRENEYRHALYAACDGMKNLDANLGKTVVSNNAVTQARALTNVVVCANEVNDRFADLPIEASEKLMTCQKFVNQAQDFARTLLAKLAAGKQLTDGERASLDGLNTVATNMYDFLQAYAESDSGMFMTNGTGMGGAGALSDRLEDVDDKAFAYEKLIYDGPFSDGVQNKQIVVKRHLSLSEVTQKVVKLFEDVQYVNTVNGTDTLYVFEGKGGRVTASVGGDIVEYAEYRENENNGNVGKDGCVSAAEEFCARLGYNVRGVWVSKVKDYVTYVDCAPVVDGAIVYPRLVKVAVAADGHVVGMEAKAYLSNKAADVVKPFGEIGSDEAKAKLADGLTVTNVAKAYVERNDKIFACWQFECVRGDRQYYVYVDSESGNEVNIFKVVCNTEGFTVI